MSKNEAAERLRTYLVSPVETHPSELQTLLDAALAAERLIARRRYIAGARVNAEGRTPEVKRLTFWGPDPVTSPEARDDFDLALREDLAAERRDFGKRVLANFSDRINRAWGNENAAKATDLLRWAVDEEAAR